MIKKKRADILIVEKGLAPSREKARALIMAGEVFTDDQKVLKPGEFLPVDVQLHIRESIPYVSRGGFKLAHALDHFNVSVKGKIALDAGASTGGFTDVLLQRGAKLVYAVDVGRGQLAWKLQSDRRVVVRDRLNIRYIKRDDLDPPPVIATLDLSFISLTLVLEPVKEVLERDKEIIVLIKPQFEVGKERVGKGGIVRNGEYRIKAVEKVIKFAEAIGLRSEGYVESPIRGQKGNVEYLSYFHL